MCDYAPNREAAMTVLATDAAGKPTVWCDPCIAPLVKALNGNGFSTIASCCGHGKVPPSVVIHGPEGDGARTARVVTVLTTDEHARLLALIAKEATT